MLLLRILIISNDGNIGSYILYIFVLDDIKYDIKTSVWRAH